MSGKCVAKLPHDCGTSKGLQVFLNDEGEYDGYCFSCGTYIKPSELPEFNGPDATPPSIKIKTKEEIEEEIAEINEYSSQDLPDRALTSRVLDHYGVKVALSEYDGTTPIASFFPYYIGHDLQGYKVKTFDGNQFAKGTTKGVDPFGWKQAMSASKYKLFITEGEYDAMALFRTLVKKWKGDGHPAVISLPHGAGSAARSLAGKVDDIRRMFKEVVLVFDNDDAGRKAVADVAKLLPGVKVAIIPSPHKDANDMTMAKEEERLFSCVMYETTTKVSTKSLRSSEVWHLAEKEPVMGLSWPWQTLTEKTRGRRRGEVYYIGAGVKMGKSVIVDMIAAHCITTQDTPVFLIKPEEPIGGTLKRLVGKVTEAIYWDPKIPFDKELFAQGKKIIDDKAIIYDGYQGATWKEVKEEIRINCALGVKDIFIDPLTVFTAGMSLTQQNEELVAIASELAQMSHELDFTAYVFCHLNRPDGGPPHERGGAVQSVQFAGSRSMMRYCNLMIGLEGNKDPDLPELERHRRDLVILEDREHGETGRIKLQYDTRTGMLKELEDLTFGDE